MSDLGACPPLLTAEAPLGNPGEDRVHADDRGDAPLDDDPVDLQSVLDTWRAEAELAKSLEELDESIEWITLAEAEDAAGVSRSTLRAWYRGGQVPSRLVPGPHGVQRMVPRDLVTDRARRSPGTGRRTGGGGDEAGRRRAAPRAAAGEQKGADVAESMLKMAQLACEQAEARAAAAEERAAHAEARAAEAEARLREAIERAAAAEARLEGS